jgi:hypothetical protein
MAKSKKSLAETHPELAKEWHPTKNGTLTPQDVTHGKEIKVWWKCNEGEDHEWEALISNRSKGSGCAICSGYKVVKSNSLRTLYPELAREWHPIKNGELTPLNVTSGSKRKIWWQCGKGADHVWEASVNNRVKGRGCPVCSGKKVVASNCLTSTHPKLAKEWHPTRNGNLYPENVVSGSHRKVWWKCPKGHDHEWQANISNRSKGVGCPICSRKLAVLSNCLATTHPVIAKDWSYERNGEVTPNDILVGSNKKFWWKCNKAEDHVYKTSPNNRLAGKNCPMCSGRQVVESNSLITKYPEIAREWHPTKNLNLTPNKVSSGSQKKVWWKCDKGADHVWNTTVANRVMGRGCPICSGHKVANSTSLVNLYPNIASEWHPTKNQDLTPFDVTPGSGKKIWWKCEKGEDHEWKASVSDRTNGQGCAVCANKIVVPSNSLATLYPDISAQWHPRLNGTMTPDQFVPGSHKKVWWLCPKGEDHEWESSIESRVNGSGCHVCQGIRVVRSNSLGYNAPDFIEQWDYKRNISLTPFDVSAKSSRLVWWTCNQGPDHKWKASVNSRLRGRGCPVCSGNKIVPSTSLLALNPTLAKEWNQNKNKRTPKEVAPFSHKKVWWQCTKDENHEWSATIANRSNGQGCPYCTLTPQSKQELVITFELKTLFRRIDPRGFKTKLDGRLRAIDIFIPKLNLCLEFDGAYWHKDKREIDKIKSNLLLKEGYSVIRVREEPLKKIHDTDVISKQPYNGKQVTNDILSMILSMYDLDSELFHRIKDYQSKDELQNERGLNRYIDKILKEKAEKK